MLKAIVFDFDGVIADSEPLHWRAFQQVAATWGRSFTYEQYLARYVGYDDRDALREMLREAGDPRADDPDRIAELVRVKGDVFEAVVRQGVTSFPGTVDFVRHAAGRLPIAIASGATRRDIDLILARLGLADLFEVIVSTDQVARSKPDPQTYVLAVRALAQWRRAAALSAGDCLAIEDTAAGIASARAAGLCTLGLTTTADARALSDAHRVAADLRGLSVDTLQGWFG